MKERAKLAVDENGVLQETGVKQVSVDDYKELVSLNYQPVNNWVVLQPLPSKEMKTQSGLIVSAGKQEYRAAVVAAPEGSKFERGMVVRIDPNMFNPVVDYIENTPILEIPEHLIKGIYTNINLKDWKSENK